MTPLEIVLITCTKCGTVYGTEAKPGESICPSCGGTARLIEIPEEDNTEARRRA